MGDNIKVVVKIRPLIKRELDEDLAPSWRATENTIIQIDSKGKDVLNQQFTFDKVYDENSQIEVLYDEIAKPIVEDATRGINGTIFAYGQTSSGKTYTMMGGTTGLGIIPLAVYNIFEKIESMSDRDFLLRISYVEIYNETIKDLLSEHKTTNLKISETPQGIKIADAEERNPSSPEQVLAIMKQGEVNRQYGSTNMNERSSRSHTIFQITIESKAHNDKDGCVNVSQLNLVDLAGSERSGQTGATGQRFKEGTHINKSLLALGLVIKQLSEDANKFVNYRDSKLTRLLQNSLGGNAKTSIICAVTPASVEETLSTLQFATRAKTIKNVAIVNAVATDATKLQELTTKLGVLQYELESKKHLEAENRRLSKSIKELQNKILNNLDSQKTGTKPSNRRKTWCAPRRNTLSTLDTIEEVVSPHRRLFHRPITQLDVLAEDENNEASTPSNPPPRRRQVTFPDKVIEIDDSDEEGIEKDTQCSPHHKCYSSSAVPPCILKQQSKKLEKEYNELLELTKYEKMFPPEQADLMQELEEANEQIKILKKEKEILETEKVIEIENLNAELNDYKNEIERLQRLRNHAETEKESALTKFAEMEISFDSFKKKALQREEELLAMIRENAANKLFDSSAAQPSKIRQPTKDFLDVSREISLIHNITDMSISQLDNEDKGFNALDQLKLEILKKENIIMQMEQKQLCANQKLELIQMECFEKMEKLEKLNYDYDAISQQNTILNDQIEAHLKTIADLSVKLQEKDKDIESYEVLIYEVRGQTKPLKDSTASTLNSMPTDLKNDGIVKSSQCENCIVLKTEIELKIKNIKYLEEDINMLKNYNENQVKHSQIYQDLEQNNYILESTLSDLKDDYKELTVRFEYTKGEFEFEKKMMEDALKRLQNEIEKKQRDCDDIINEERRINEIQHKEELSFESELESLKIKLKQQEDLLKDQQYKNIEKLKQEVFSKEEEVNTHDDDLGQLKLEITNLQNELSSQTQKTNELKKSIEEYNKVIFEFLNLTEFKQQYDEYETEKDKPLNIIKAVLEYINDQKPDVKVQNLLSTIESLKKEIDTYKNEIVDMQLTFQQRDEELRTMLSNSQSECEQFKSEVDKKSQELSYLEAFILWVKKQFSFDNVSKIKDLKENLIDIKRRYYLKEQIVKEFEKGFENLLELENLREHLIDSELLDFGNLDSTNEEFWIDKQRVCFDKLSIFCKHISSNIKKLQHKNEELTSQMTSVSEKYQDLLNESKTNRAGDASQSDEIRDINTKLEMVVADKNLLEMAIKEIKDKELTSQANFDELLKSEEQLKQKLEKSHFIFDLFQNKLLKALLSSSFVKNAEQFAVHDLGSTSLDNIETIIDIIKDAAQNLMDENNALKILIKAFEDKESASQASLDELLNSEERFKKQLEKSNLIFDLLQNKLLKVLLSSCFLENPEQFVLHDLGATSVEKIEEIIDLITAAIQNLQATVSKADLCEENSVTESHSASDPRKVELSNDTDAEPDTISKAKYFELEKSLNGKNKLIYELERRHSNCEREIMDLNVVLNENKFTIIKLNKQLENSDKKLKIVRKELHRQKSSTEHNETQTESQGCEYNTLNSELEALKDANNKLEKEQSEVKHECGLLLNLSAELQKQINWHRINLSTLMATTYAENKLMQTEHMCLKAKHNRLHKVCHKELLDMRQPLQELYDLLKAGAIEQTDDFRIKANSTLESESNQNFKSAYCSFNSTLKEFENESTLPSDALMLDDEVTLDYNVSNQTLKAFSVAEIDTSCNPTKLIDRDCQTSHIYESTKLQIEENSQYKNDKKDVNSKDIEFTRISIELNKLKNEKLLLQQDYDTLSTEMMDNILELDSLKTQLESLKAECVMKNKAVESLKSQINSSNLALLSNDKLSASEEALYEAEWHESTSGDSLSQFKKRCSTIEGIHIELAASMEDIKKINDEVNGLEELTQTENLINQKEMQPDFDGIDLFQPIKSDDIKDANSSVHLKTIEHLSDRLKDSIENYNFILSESNAAKVHFVNFIKEKIGNEFDMPLELSFAELVNIFYDNILINHGNEVENLRNEIRLSADTVKTLNEKLVDVEGELQCLKNNSSHPTNSLENESYPEIVRACCEEIFGKVYYFDEDRNIVTEFLNKCKIEIENLRELVNRKDEEINEKEDYCLELEIKTEEQIKTNDVLKTTIENYAVNINELKATMKKCENDFEERIKEKNYKISSIEKEIDTLNSYNIELNHINSDLTRDISKCHKVIDSLKSSVSQISEKNKQLNEQMKDDVKEIEALKEQRSKVNELIAQNEELIIKMEDHQKSISSLSEQNNQLTYEKKKLSELYSKLQADYEALTDQTTSENQNLKEIASKQKEMVNKILFEKSELFDDYNKLKEDCENLITEHNKCDERYNVLMETLTRERAEFKEHENKKYSEMDQVEIMQEKISNYESIVEEKESCLAKLQQTHIEMQTVLREKNQSLLKQLDMMNKDKTSTEKYNSEKLTEMQSNYTKLISELIDLKKINSILENENSSNKEQLENSESLLADSKLVIAKMNERILQLQERIFILENVGTEKDKKIALLEKENYIKAEEHKSAIEKELINTKERLKAKTNECLMVQKNIKTHQKSAEYQMTIIKRTKAELEQTGALLKQREIELKAKCEELDGLRAALTALQNSCDNMALEINNLKALNEMLEEAGAGRGQHSGPHSGRSSLGADSRRSKRISLHDKMRHISDNDQMDYELTGGNTLDPEALRLELSMLGVVGEKQTQVERVSSRRNSLEAALSPLNMNKENRRRSDRIRTKRQSIHDLSRRSNDNDNFDITKLPKEELATESELREALRILKINYVDLEQRYKDVDEECELCGQALRERDEQYSRVRAQRDALQAKLVKMQNCSLNQSGISSPTYKFKSSKTMQDASTNTTAAPSFGSVDLFTFEREKDKCRKLQAMLEDVRSKNSDLNAELRRLQHAANNAESTVALLTTQPVRDLEDTVKKLEDENESLKETLAENKTLKKRVQELSKQHAKAAVPVSSGPSPYATSGSGIVEGANISALLYENHKLKEKNEKLLKFYKKYKKSKLEGNENAAP